MTKSDTRFDCPVCISGQLIPFLELEGLPVHVGVLWETQEGARECQKGDMELGLCNRCGFIFNVAFDSSLVDYKQNYDNSLHASAVFRVFEESLVDHLIKRYGLRNKTITEIGCGNGHFLGLLCERGNNQGIGIDPSHGPDYVDPLARNRVKFIQEYYSDFHTDYPTDLICCRHVLEHIEDPVKLVGNVRRALNRYQSAVVYFEVPNGLLAFRDLSIWDFVYEHCGYFLAETLRYLFESNGYQILSISELYDGQFLGLEARRSSAQGDAAAASQPVDLSSIDQYIKDFSAHFAARLQTWKENLQRFADSGTRVVAWGGGARAVSFFSMLGVSDEISYVIDQNERKQGLYLAGTGHRIMAPQFLTDYKPDVVVVINPIYTDEIRETLQQLGITAEVMPA